MSVAYCTECNKQIDTDFVDVRIWLPDNQVICEEHSIKDVVKTIVTHVNSLRKEVEKLKERSDDA